MEMDNIKYEKLRKFCIIALGLQVFCCSTVILIQLISLKSSLFLILVPLVVYILPSIIFLAFIKIKKENFTTIKKLLPFYLALECFLIGAVGGGVRSISFLILYTVPFVAFALEENVLYVSLFALLEYAFFIVIWFLPPVDSVLMNLCLYPKETLLAPNMTYVIMFIGIYACISTFALYFSKENRKYKQIIEDKTTTLEKAILHLAQANKAIEEKERQKTTFFINLTHEIKTPLTLIKNYLDQDLKERGTSANLQTVKQNVDKLTQDVINFMDIEKLERGQVFYDHDAIVDVSRVATEEVNVYKDIASLKNLILTGNIQKEIYARIDPSALDRILNNLIENAIKYTEKGEIKVELSSNEMKIALAVRDTGIGIDNNQLPHIFEPYYQISNVKRNTQGIGMGLNIVKKIIDELNGEIKVESEVNQGTCFTILLDEHQLQKDDIVINPDFTPPIYSLYDIQPLENIATEHKKTIMLIEDNREMINYLVNNLKNEYNVYYALNGKEALTKISSIPRPDIFISDIMMDEMDGYQFYEEIRKTNFKNVPFIFLTAKTLHEEKMKGLKMGAFDYITKPFNIDELLAKIESFLKNFEVVKEERGVELSREKEERIQALFKKAKLSPTEKKVIYQLLANKANREASFELGMAQKTFEVHISHANRKFYDIGIVIRDRRDLFQFIKEL